MAPRAGRLRTLTERYRALAERLRDQLAFALRVTAHYPGPHLGPFVIPCDPLT